MTAKRIFGPLTSADARVARLTEMRREEALILHAKSGLQSVGALWADGFQVQKMHQLRILLTEELKKHQQLLADLKADK